jgi:hypothetical protein
MNTQLLEHNPLAQILENFPKRIPKTTFAVLLLLCRHPWGIAFAELVDLIHGEIRHSNNVEFLAEARRETTRKQLQRARFFLSKHRSGLNICYCRREKLWKLIPIV